MPFKFIDNQPVRFNSAKFDDQSCINRDTSAYQMLVARGDPVCVQLLQECKAGNVACLNAEVSNELVTDGDFSNAAAFTETGGWSIAAGVASFAFAGGDGSVTQSGLLISVGAQYRIQITINSNTTGHDISVALGGRRIGLINANATGIQTLYGPAGVTDEVSFNANNDFGAPTQGAIEIDNLSVKQIAFCYQFDTSTIQHVQNGTFTGNADGWTTESGWGYSTNDVDAVAVGVDKYIHQQLPNIGHREDITFSMEITASSGGATSLTMQYGNTIIAPGLSGVTTVAVHTQVYPAYGINDDILRIGGSAAAFTGTIDNVSALEEKSGWSYDSVSGFCHTPGWANAFYSTEPLEIGSYYELTIEVTMSEGSLYVECGGVVMGTITQSGIYTFYFTALTTEADKYTPSIDFDGCISPDINICQLREDIEFRLIHDDGTGATDWYTLNSPQDEVRFKGRFVAWCITSLDDALSGGISVEEPFGCYYVQVREGEDTPYTSDTIINYQNTHDCTKRIRAWADGESLGFHFGDNGDFFILTQRFRTLYMNPVYPIEGEDYELSSGTIQRIFAKGGKQYELEFDYMDEYGHDTMSVMIKCDIFELDGVEYQVPFKDYEPQWAERGRRNLAKSTIEIQKRIEGILFNRNC